MKSILAVLFTFTIATSIGFAQDKDTEEQLKQANDAAKRMGIKAPDTKQLMQDMADDDAVDAKEAKAAAATETASATPSAGPKINVDIPAGAAKGSITFDGNTSELKFASAFIDQKDERKPVVLIVSDQKLPAEKWTSEFDMMRDHTKWSGITVFLDKDGSIYRTDVHSKGQQSSVSGMFDVKINEPTSSDLAGIAKTDTASSDRKLDVTFHAARK